MNLNLADKIAHAVLYEGYILYPYRPDNFKNRQRWTFGGLFPSGYDTTERSTAQAECLLAARPGATLDIRVRFLQLQERSVAQLLEPAIGWDPANVPASVPVDTLTVGERTLHGWQEAVEREAAFTGIALADISAGPRPFDFDFPASQAIEPVQAESGAFVGLITRQQQALKCRLEVQATASGDSQPLRLSLRISNLTELPAGQTFTRDQAALWSLASTHLLLGVHEGQFYSAFAPPEAQRELAAACRQDGLWPVLVGEASEADLMLAAPIILYDYPTVAPESPGDLFDGTEIDEILTLRILTLTEAEKAAMRELDEHSRALLQRVENLSPESLRRLHGTLRKPTELEPPQ